MRANILILFMVTLLVGCRRDLIGEDSGGDSIISLDIFVGSGSITRASSSSDDTFSDLALYVFNQNGELELSHFEQGLSAQIMVEIPLQLLAGDKEILIFANYLDKTLLSDGQEYSLNSSSTYQELTNLTTSMDGEFSPESLLMVGWSEVTIDTQSEGSYISMELRRLSARVDIHVFKGDGFGDESVTLQGVTLSNQILNSQILFDYDDSLAQMVSPELRGDSSVECGYLIDSYDESVDISQRSADATIYSYPNILSSSSSQVDISSVEISLLSGGFSLDYLGDIESGGSYSLFSNNLYRVVAILDPYAAITLSVEVMDWSSRDIILESTLQHYLTVSEDDITITNISSYTISYACDLPISITNISAQATLYDSSVEPYIYEYSPGESSYPLFDINTFDGTITISSAIPINYLRRYITFTVESESGLSIDVQMVHYPPIYVTVRASTGCVTPEWYSGGSNLNLFTINVLVSSSDGSYILGDPTYGTPYTDSGEEGNRFVSPQFIIASQYGIYPSVSYDVAQQRCLEYGEDIYRSGWRMPTKAEMLIIDTIQDDEMSAIHDLLSGSAYWTAYKWQYYNFDYSTYVDSSSTESAYVRPVYDLYKYGGSNE